MTKTQAIAFLFQSWEEHDSEARGITAAMCLSEGRYVVRDPRGIARAMTDRLDYARAARLQTSGVIYDRADWRNNPVTLNQLGMYQSEKSA